MASARLMLSRLTLLLHIFNLLVGIGFLVLSGRYLLDMFLLIDAPDPRWIGWFVDDLLGLGMSAKSSQLVVCMMLLIGISLVITSTHDLYVRVTAKEKHNLPNLSNND